MVNVRNVQSDSLIEKVSEELKKDDRIKMEATRNIISDSENFEPRNLSLSRGSYNTEF